jgi:phenylacetate-CoA ligase
MALHRLEALAGLWRRTRGRRDALDAFRTRQLRRLIRHAHARVPYYRDLLDRHALRPESIRTVADLAVLPITRKRDLQLLPPSQVVAAGVDPARLIERHTSGSSGQPFTIRRSWTEERLLGAFRWRALHAMGLAATDRHADVEEIQPRDPSDDQRLHRALQALGLYRQLRIHALEPPGEILRTLARYRPDVVTGYAGVVARVAHSAGGAADGLRPRFVAVHSDTLTPHMRTQIETAFAAPVYQIYDSNEFNVIAWECVRSGALHTCDDSTLVEVLIDGRPAAPGERGEVVLTALHSFAMPFIRYALGDLVTQGDALCGCGQPFATIRAVQGRMFDYFPLPDGRAVHPYEIIAILGETAPWIREFQLVQERMDLVRLRLVPSESPSAARLAGLEHAIAAFLGRDVTVRVEAVDEIRLEPNAKLRVCRSLVASEYDATEGGRARE